MKRECLRCRRFFTSLGNFLCGSCNCRNERVRVAVVSPRAKGVRIIRKQK